MPDFLSNANPPALDNADKHIREQLIQKLQTLPIDKVNKVAEFTESLLP